MPTNNLTNPLPDIKYITISKDTCPTGAPIDNAMTQLLHLH